MYEFISRKSKVIAYRFYKFMGMAGGGGREP